MMSSFRVRVGVVCIVFAALVSVSSASSAAIQIKVRAGTDSEEVLDLYSEYHALVVGIGDYGNGWKDLPNAVKDAENVARMLGDLGWDVDLVKNLDGQKLNLKLNELIVETAEDSDKGVLVWFSGHGHTQEKADGTPLGYLVPADAPDPYRDPAGFITTAIDMDRILSVSNQIRAKHVLMIFDSCFSGTLFATTRSARPSPYIRRKVAKPVRQFITAGQAEEVVPDYSVFHKTFLAGIEEREADLNKDSYITGTELGSYLAEKVTNYSGGSQNPVFGKIQNPSLDKGDFVFALTAPAIELEPGPTARSNQVDKRVIELEVWREIKGTEDPSLYEQFLRQFPEGVFSGLAKHRLNQMGDSPLDKPVNDQIVGLDQRHLEAGLQAYFEDNYTEAFRLLSPLAVRNNIRAMVRVARMFLEGRGTERDKPRAIGMFSSALAPLQLAAREGRAWAQSDLADYYVDGIVIDRNLASAAFWYREAAEQGYAPAQTNLGWLYFNGYEGVAPDLEIAVYWFNEAAAQGNRAAISNLNALGEAIPKQVIKTEEEKAEAGKEREKEAERKRKEVDKSKDYAAAKVQRERDESEAVSAFGAVAWAIKEQVSENWNEPGDFSGLSVAFLVRVDREGNVLWVKMNRSSGNGRLDESAENAIFKASPLPFPKEARFYEYLKEFNFVFKPEKDRNETQASVELQDSDRRLAAQTLQKALESAKDGAEADWQNPKTGNRGIATPTKTIIRSDGTPCREFRTEVTNGRDLGVSRGEACRRADGSWKIQG